MQRNVKALRRPCAVGGAISLSRKKQTNNNSALSPDGPSSVTVAGPANVADDVQTVTLTCTASEAYPSADFTWSIPCVTLNSTPQVSTCTFTRETVGDVAEEAVCLAVNSRAPELNATDSYQFPFASK